MLRRGQFGQRVRRKLFAKGPLKFTGTPKRVEAVHEASRAVVARPIEKKRLRVGEAHAIFAHLGKRTLHEQLTNVGDLSEADLRSLGEIGHPPTPLRLKQERVNDSRGPRRVKGRRPPRRLGLTFLALDVHEHILKFDVTVSREIHPVDSHLSAALGCPLGHAWAYEDRDASNIQSRAAMLMKPIGERRYIVRPEPGLHLDEDNRGARRYDQVDTGIGAVRRWERLSEPQRQKREDVLYCRDSGSLKFPKIFQ